MSQFAAVLASRLRAAEVAAKLARLLGEDDIAQAHELDREHLYRIAQDHGLDPRAH